MKNELFLYLTDIAGKTLCTVGLNGYFQSKKDVRFVFYHGIGDGSSDCMKFLDDEIPMEVFEKHVGYLVDNYTCISMAQAVENLRNGETASDKPYCNISFDDGLSTVFTKAFPLLKEKGIPFDVFINTEVVDNKGLLWLHTLNYVLSASSLKDVRDLTGEYSKTNLAQIINCESELENWYRENFEIVYRLNLLSRIAEKIGIDPEQVAKDQDMYLTVDQIKEMNKSGANFHSHTHSHYPLAVFTDELVIEEQIHRAFQDMAEMELNGEWKNYFISFPFGMKKDYGEYAIKQAFTTGHSCVVEVGDGFNNSKRVRENNIISRVSLGTVSPSSSSLYSAIELRPVFKSRIRKILG